MIKPRDAADWWTVLIAALFTIIVIIGPIYISNQVEEDTDRIIGVLERQSEAAQRQAIRVNVLTITCVARLPEEERTDPALDACIREGLEDAEEIGSAGPLP